MHLIISDHAMIRAAQRNLMRNAGAIFCQLRAKDLPASAIPNQRRLAGTTLVLCKCGHFLITAYRDPDAFKRDLKKEKYDLSRGETPCPWCL